MEMGARVFSYFLNVSQPLPKDLSVSDHLGLTVQLGGLHGSGFSLVWGPFRHSVSESQDEIPVKGGSLSHPKISDFGLCIENTK